MRIAEIFGISVDDVSPQAQRERERKWCPFKDEHCTKSHKTDPIGVCSLADGSNAVSLCPTRFLESGRIFTDVAEIAFGPGAEISVFPEVKVLRVIGSDGRERKIGKVDFLVAKIVAGTVADFAAVEVQATYFGGKAIRPLMNHFLRHHNLDELDTRRRPDFRSSAQKRLVPQLMLKVPIFRRWSKKFFVVVDQKFFSALPEFRQSSVGNSELSWLAYPFANSAGMYRLGNPQIAHCIWEDVAHCLREGAAPELSEITDELQSKYNERTAAASGQRRSRARSSQP